MLNKHSEEKQKSKLEEKEVAILYSKQKITIKEESELYPNDLNLYQISKHTKSEMEGKVYKQKHYFSMYKRGEEAMEHFQKECKIYDIRIGYKIPNRPIKNRFH